MKNIFLITFILCFVVYSNAQEVIHLENPSFEGTPNTYQKLSNGWNNYIKHKLPKGWKNSAEDQFPNESPPDHHPNNLFGVTEPAQDGQYYVGLVTRDVDSWESIGQELAQPLLKGKTYEFSLYLRLPQNYISYSQLTRQEENFNQPVILRIWGSQEVYKKTELLAQSPIIEHNQWKKYTFQFTPKEDNWTSIAFEAYYDKKLLFAYNGSILIDHCSPIRRLPDNLSSMLNNMDSTNTDSLTKAKAILNFVIERETYQTDNESILKIKTLLDLQSTLSQGGVRNFIFNHSSAEIMAAIDLLKTFDLQKVAAILNKVNDIYTTQSSDLTQVQKDYFKTCETVFNTQYNEALIEQKILNFIQQNETTILENDNE